MRTIAVVVILLAICSISFAEYSTGFCPPVDEKYVANSKYSFGLAGDDYFKDAKFWHCGQDIMCPIETPVRAIADGKIVVCSPTGWDDNGQFLNFAIIIEHITTSGYRFHAIYGHLRRPVKDGVDLNDDEVRSYRIGEKVSKGEVIGKIGFWAVGNHLHFGIYYNVNFPDQFPTNGFGMQKLPLPAATEFHGIKCYANWYDPIAWIRTFSPTRYSCGYEHYMAAATNNRLFYLRDSAANSWIMAADLDGQNQKMVFKVPKSNIVSQIFAGPGDSIYFKLHNELETALFHLTENQAGRMYTIPHDFTILPWHSETDYAPYVDDQSGWRAFDFRHSVVVDRSNAFNDIPAVQHGKVDNTDDINDKFGWLKPAIPVVVSNPGPRIWRILTDKIEFKSGKKQLVCWIVDGQTQKFFPLTNPIRGECSGIEAIDNCSGDPTANCKILYGYYNEGTKHWQILNGILVPNSSNAILYGYHLVPGQRFLNTNDDEFLEIYYPDFDSPSVYVSLRKDGTRNIYSCDLDGSNLHQITK
ncbi:MAG: M23 family metallopeptidase [Candidatus Berkelbacteria bacterium]|nr:M23 family metallopeptidase [Candidatus Berkelbacteria bacterium]